MKKASRPFHLVVCFTYGVSLKLWVDTGLIGREILLYKRMVEKGHKVTFLTFGDKNDYKYSGILSGIDVFPVYEYLKKRRNRWVNFLQSFLIPFKFRHLFRSSNIIKTNQMYGAWVPTIASILFKKKLIVRCGYEMLRNLLRDEQKRGPWLFKGLSGYLLEFIAYTVAHKVVITNRADMKFIKACFHVNPKKLILIRNFIDTHHFAPQQNSCAGNRQILFVGRLEPRKNVVNLLKAVAQSGNRLNIVGDGPQKASLKRIASDTNADVRFIGVFDNSQLPKVINRYSIFILPSLYENNPKALLEAMSCARIVIGTDADGIRELIEDGITGFLCDPEMESIQRVIEKINDMDLEELSLVAGKSRQFVIKECSIEKVYEQETAIYESS